MKRRETQTPARKEIDIDTISRQIQKVIDDTRGKSGALIRVLQQTQGIVGYLPTPVLEIISRDLKVPLSEVYGIVSFYHFFTMVPKGKYVIQVCMGTSCYVKGGQRVLDTMKKEYNLEPEGITPDGKFSLENVRCLGCCGLSPVMAIGEAVYRRVKPGDVKGILSSYE
jgi:NADH:ubiquinone oxidoreductase subunit E